MTTNTVRVASCSSPSPLRKLLMLFMTFGRTVSLARGIIQTTNRMSSKQYEAGLLGALIGDAATMPVHWIYEEKKLHDALVDSSKPEFNPTLSCPFYSSTEFPNHYDKGQCSPYGEQFVALLKSVRSNNGNADIVAQNFYDWLTDYTGRKDKAGKEFHENYRNGKRNPECGADDNQAQCLSKAVIAVGAGYADNVGALISFHQNNNIAIGCGQVYAKFLHCIKTGKRTPREAFNEVFVHDKDSLPEFLQPHIEFLLKHIDSGDTKTMLQAWAQEFSQKSITAISCLNPPAFLRSLHISVHATSYEQGIRKNLILGGDNCSTAIAIGAALGYHFGVPEDWMKQPNNTQNDSLA
eukprot:CCRYP_010744-RA/>CCRYP_010744-RA protein AED:0.00 eAED:0.00 QI:294/1/1/1/0/0/2/77/351